MAPQLDPKIRQVLARGAVIPAHPLALTAERQLDERRQRALTRYYVAAGAGGLAVGVHTTQFAIREPRIGLFEPVLKLAAEEMDRADCDRAEHPAIAKCRHRRLLSDHSCRHFEVRGAHGR